MVYLSCMNKKNSLVFCRRPSLWFQGLAKGRGRVSPRAKGKLSQTSCFHSTERAAVNYEDAPKSWGCEYNLLGGFYQGMHGSALRAARKKKRKRGGSRIGRSLSPVKRMSMCYGRASGFHSGQRNLCRRPAEVGTTRGTGWTGIPFPAAQVP